MRRVLILGPYGSGKSTFAKKLGEVTGLELWYLDSIWFLRNGAHIDRTTFESRVGGILERDSWIMEGNYLGTLERRLARCDTVFLLDIPTDICIEGIRVRDGKVREGHPAPQTETRELILATRNFRAQSMPVIYELIRKYHRGRDICIFHSRREVDEYLQELGTGRALRLRGEGR